jgi:hypothetical protein
MLFEESAGDVELGRDVKVFVVFPEIGQKGDLGGVAHQPGGLMVARSGAGVECRDPEDDPEAMALGAHRPAGRIDLGRGGGGRHHLRYLAERSRWHYSRSRIMFVKLFTRGIWPKTAGAGMINTTEIPTRVGEAVRR